jgi:hypothetical protein
MYASPAMSDHRLPLKVIRIPGGAKIVLATGESLYVYGREPEVARAANAMTRQQSEELAAEVARALTAQWSGSE